MKYVWGDNDILEIKPGNPKQVRELIELMRNRGTDTDIVDCIIHVCINAEKGEGTKLTSRYQRCGLSTSLELAMFGSDMCWLDLEYAGLK